jgi:cytochrome d ubiquinol oxidase subunit II
VILWVVATLFSRAAAPRLWEAYGNGVAWIAPVVFVAAAAVFPLALRRGRRGLAFASSSIAIAALIGVMGQGLYPNMVPALGDASRSLTIYNASSNPYTLTTMLVIALVGMPLVLAYTIFIYSRFRGPVELHDHSY